VRSRDIVKIYAIYFRRFTVIWFVTLIAGTPLIVLSVGYKLRDGWNLIVGHPKTWAAFAAYPFIMIGLHLAKAIFTIRRIEARTLADTKEISN
jgi:hypothetical protein